ncbi:MAG: hypothetical protein ABI599_13345 [Flavobacteriales bacterium]
MKSICSLVFALTVRICAGQDSTLQKIRAPLWTFHESGTKTFGLNFGVLGNDDWARNVTTVGARVEAPGIGLFLFLVPYLPIPKDSAEFAADSAHQLVERIHGLNLSPLGSACDCSLNGINVSGGGTWFYRTNGVSASWAINGAVIHNGVQIAGWTQAYRMNGLQLSIMGAGAIEIRGVQIAAETGAKRMVGVQIGLYNRAENLKGLQIGLWNVNQKRKLPFFNWA